MRYLKTSEAAALLNVSPNTLRAWERRFGFPKPQRSPGKHRLFTHGEVAALRDALQEGSVDLLGRVPRARRPRCGQQFARRRTRFLRARAGRCRDRGRARAALGRALGRRGSVADARRDRPPLRHRIGGVGIRSPVGNGLVAARPATGTPAGAPCLDCDRRRLARRARPRCSRISGRSSCSACAPA